MNAPSSSPRFNFDVPVAVYHGIDADLDFLDVGSEKTLDNSQKGICGIALAETAAAASSFYAGSGPETAAGHLYTFTFDGAGRVMELDEPLVNASEWMRSAASNLIANDLAQKYDYRMLTDTEVRE